MNLPCWHRRIVRLDNAGEVAKARLIAEIHRLCDAEAPSFRAGSDVLTECEVGEGEDVPTTILTPELNCLQALFFWSMVRS